MKWKTIFPVYLLFFSVTVFCQESSSHKKMADEASAKNAAFESYVKQAMKQWKTPGLSVAVVKDGKLVYKNGFGVTEIGKPEPFTTSTMSICASTTKAMTAVCLGMLVDEGKLKWT